MEHFSECKRFHFKHYFAIHDKLLFRCLNLSGKSKDVGCTADANIEVSGLISFLSEYFYFRVYILLHAIYFIACLCLVSSYFSIC